MRQISVNDRGGESVSESLGIKTAAGLRTKAVGNILGTLGRGLGIAALTNTAGRAATGEDINPALSLGVGALGAAAGGKSNWLRALGPLRTRRNLLNNAATQGLGLTAFDAMQKRRQGFSMLDPESVSEHISDKLTGAWDRVSNTPFGNMGHQLKQEIGRLGVNKATPDDAVQSLGDPEDLRLRLKSLVESIVRG